MNAVEQLLTSAAWLMLDWSVRWGVLIGLLAVWFGWRPPRRSEVRHALAWGVLVVGLGLPLPPLWGPGFWQPQASLAHVALTPKAPQHAEGRENGAVPDTLEQPTKTDAHVIWEQTPGDAGVPFEQATGGVVARASGEGTEPAPAAVARTGAVDAGETLAAPPAHQLDGRRLLVLALSGLYLGGVVWSLLRITGGAFLLARLRRTAREVDEDVRAALADGCVRLRLSRPVRIAAHDAVRSPLVCGLFRPLILVPGDWTDVPAADQRACLLHELAHVQRGDSRALVFTELVQAVFFFHPLVRWLVHRIDLEREFICDEIAASLHGQPQDYARILVDVAGRAGRFHAGPGRTALSLPMSRRRTIAKRVNHLLDFPVTAGTARVQRVWQWALTFAAIVVGTGIGSLRLTAEAAPRPAEAASATHASEPPPPAADSPSPIPAGRVLGAGPFFGTVVDSRGKPVAQARVRLVHPQKERPPAVLQETTSDPAGRFRIDAWQDTSIAKPSEDFRWPSLIVSDPNGRVGGLYTPYFRIENGPHEPLIRLLEVQQYQGRLVSADETPITGARITAQAWHRGGQFYDRDSFEIPAELIERWSAQTDVQGQFVLRGVPAEGFLTVAIVAEEFGSPRANLSLTDPATIRLARPVSLRGSVVAAGSTTGLAGIPIRIQPVESPAGGSERSFRVGMPAARTETVSDASGRFAFEVVPGKYEVAASPDGDQPYGAERGQAVVDSGKESALVLTLPKAVRIQGQVVDRENGQGLRGVRMSFSPVGKDGRQLDSRSTTTNDRGEYSVFTKGGKIRVSVDVDGYVRPDPKDLPSLEEVSADTTWPKIELTRKARVNIVVVDQSGRPVPEAKLDVMSREVSSSAQYEVAPDRRGGFVLTTNQPAAAVELRPRSDNAASERPVVIVPADVTDPVRIVLSATRCFVLTGKVVDDAGAPVPHASLRVHTSRQRPNGGSTGLVCCTSVADGDGNFRIGGLWPGDGYQVQAEAPWHDTWASKSVQGVAGEMHELPAIVLQRATYVLEGQVVDARGTPLAGVRVFNAGDAPRLLTANTDAEGRFRLEGFRAGPVFVFAEKDGYRFTGLRTEAGAERLVIRLMRGAKPTTPRDPPARPGTPVLARQREVARQVLEELWTAENRGLVAYFGMAAMARVDLARAITWCEQMGERRDSYATLARTEKARCLALDGDVDGSLAVIADMHDAHDDYFAFIQVLELADRFADTNPAIADRFVADARRFLKDMNESEQVNAQAKLGGILLRLGHTAEGRRLVESAADAATRLGWTESATIARALACYDTTRALKFVPPETNSSEHYRSLANLAIAAARYDASQGRTLFESVERRYRYDERALAPVAYNMALKAPEAAIQFVEAYGEGSRDLGRTTARVQAPAWGWIAVAIADRDPERARALIDRGLVMCMHSGSSWHDSDWDQYGGRPAQAALLAVQAEMIGYPDMESVCHRVLASRMTTDSGSEALSENVTQVALLALVQPELARDVLQIMESRIAGMMVSPIARMEMGLLAWSLVAPDQFPDRARRYLAEAKDANLRYRMLNEILHVAAVLTASPSDRPELIMRGLWMPGKDL
jgi:beta-lactamase regulating signal transducer with metallopeptidase domain